MKLELFIKTAIAVACVIIANIIEPDGGPKSCLSFVLLCIGIIIFIIDSLELAKYKRHEEIELDRVAFSLERLAERQIGQGCRVTRFKQADSDEWTEVKVVDKGIFGYDYVRK